MRNPLFCKDGQPNDLILEYYGKDIGRQIANYIEGLVFNGYSLPEIKAAAEFIQGCILSATVKVIDKRKKRNAKKGDSSTSN